jgi:uncharacterized peroxidase-related enzyme
MAFIALPDIKDVDDYTRRVFVASKAITGEISDTARILATRQDIMKMTNVMIRTLLVEETELDHPTKEWIAIFVSLKNGCAVCVDEHKRIAKLLGITEEQIDKALADAKTADFPEKRRMLLNFCLKITRDSYKVGREDLDALRDVGYTDSQLLEAAAIVGYFNYINTIANSMGSGRQ